MYRQALRFMLTSGRRFARTQNYAIGLNQDKKASFATQTPQKMVRNKSVNFLDYDCIGFDLDNTLCKYNIGQCMKLEYQALANYLVTKKSYSKDHLLRPIEDNEDFLIKGLILDMENGNLLKVGPTGEILTASHGTKRMTSDDIKEVYGENSHWDVTDIYCQDPLQVWNGPLSERIRALLDYFDMPAGLAFARAVDSVDKLSTKNVKPYKIWPDILEGLIDMYAREHFGANHGDYFPLIKSKPEMYIRKCSEATLNWLRALKAQNKVLFLITGSHIDFASLTSNTSIGSDWKDLFDVVVFYAKKPGFFTETRPFYELNNNVEVTSHKPLMLKKGGFYSQGNWVDLKSFLSTTCGKQNPKIVYVGDNLIQDIYTPSMYTDIDTVAIVEELAAEGLYDFPQTHKDQNLLVSNHWGSFFHDDSGTVTIWKHFIDKHANICVPSINFIAQRPLAYTFIKNM